MNKYTRSITELSTLLAAGIIYWLTLYPLARSEIRRWRLRAETIPDPVLRNHALHKLTAEHLNPEAAVFFAILAPRRLRRRVARLIVSYQIAYDYLDAVNERPDGTSLRNGLQLHQALCDPMFTQPSRSDYYRYNPQHHDGGYLADLTRESRQILQQLPATAAIEGVLHRAAQRCGEAQSRNHATTTEGQQQLIDWTARQARADYEWWELAAAGISCLAIHALFATAARPTTLADAEAVDGAYYPSVCAISALLDSLIDHAADSQTDNHSFTAHYLSPGTTAARFEAIIREARTRLRPLASGPRHCVILDGIASFYLSDQAAHTAIAKPATQRTRAWLGLASRPMLTVMAAKRRRSTSLQQHSTGAPGSPQSQSSRLPPE